MACTTLNYPISAKFFPGIRSRADRLDASGEWPEEDLRVLSSLGAMRWAVPLSLGGEELSPIELHFRYEAIASASLTTALILTQRDSAIGIIAAANRTGLRDELLTKLANNELFTTVGIAQLTTSRQRGAPSLVATPLEAGGYRIDGEIPWVTGASHAQFIVSGAVLEDRRQILFAVPAAVPGVQTAPPMQLVWRYAGAIPPRSSAATWSLSRGTSCTAQPRGVLDLRRGNLPIGQAFLAMGLAREALNLIETIGFRHRPRHACAAGITIE